MNSRARPWAKPAAYIALASFSCLLYSAFTPPLLSSEAASRLPLVGSLPGDLPGYWTRFILSFLLLGLAPALMALAFREKPALHRFPATMARRTQEFCAALVSDYDGDGVVGVLQRRVDRE